jgi:hypothetical protein
MKRTPIALAAIVLLSLGAPVLPVTGATTANNIDAPEISRSRGAKGGVVVLWPRIIPAWGGSDTQVLARQVQEKLVALARQAYPGRPIDIRPSPERVCPMGGCDAVAVGALLMRDGEGCAIVALVSPAGTSPTTLVPWAGSVRLRAGRVPFRQPPENWVTITDFGRCDRLDEDLEANRASIVSAMREFGR